MIAEEKSKLDEDIQLFANELKICFSEEEIEEIARKTGFVKRSGKIKAREFVCLCCFMDVEVANNTLVTLCTKLSAKIGIVISNQALDQRLNERCVEFLKKIFEKLLHQTITNNTCIASIWDEYFKRIRILDSTAFQVPESYKDIYPGSGGCSQPSGVKIQLEYELKSGNLVNVEVGAGSGSDNTFGSKIRDTVKAGDLILRDLGYFSFEDFLDVEKREAFYISRLKPNIAVYIENDNIEYYKNGAPRKSSLFKRIYISDIMKQMKDGERYEIKDAYVGKEKTLKTRIILYKLTKEQLEKRSEKCAKNAKKKGIEKSDNTIELLGISIYITNIEEAVLSAEQVHEFYSLRWQIEIVFKTWKSIFHIHGVKPVKIERFQCQLYGKLILLFLSSAVMFKMRTLVLENKELEASEIKASEIVHEYIDRLYFELVKFPSRTFNTLKLVFENVVKNGLKSHRKDKKTVFDILGVRYKRSSMRAKIAA
ncbi:IS4 family transposase [Clostridium estertheticum]|uniref:IS4 family transposase n=1 Tax=Clostridium estertheticum TaxID=238834 RepID=UPI001CD0F1AD|nr:IS4 family transposase [Clostridium estertheticum]MBZ9689868.1 IS4 family transposase [Clostridium estertheticum]